MAGSHEVTRRKIVAVIGGHDELSKEQDLLVTQVGREIAKSGYHLLTGGGPGVMEAACRGFTSDSKSGVAIGVIPHGKDSSKYPNKYVELPIYTHLEGTDPTGPDSRNHINVRTCNALVVFRGGRGTRAELKLARKLQPRPPIVACIRDGETVGRLDRQQLEKRGLTVVDDANAVAQFLSAKLS